MQAKALVLGLALLALSALAACGGSEDESADATAKALASADATVEAIDATASAATSAEDTYLEKVDTYADKIGDMVESINDALERSWPTAEQLVPPDRFRDDHDLYLEALRQAVESGREHDQAVLDRDLVSVNLARAKMLEAQGIALARVSRRFAGP